MRRQARTRATPRVSIGSSRRRVDPGRRDDPRRAHVRIPGQVLGRRWTRRPRVAHAVGAPGRDQDQAADVAGEVQGHGHVADRPRDRQDGGSRQHIHGRGLHGGRVHAPRRVQVQRLRGAQVHDVQARGRRQGGRRARDVLPGPQDPDLALRGCDRRVVLHADPVPAGADQDQDDIGPELRRRLG